MLLFYCILINFILTDTCIQLFKGRLLEISFFQDFEQVLQRRRSNAWSATKEKITMDENFPILCVFCGGIIAISGDQMGTFCILENVALV